MSDELEKRLRANRERRRAEQPPDWADELYGEHPLDGLERRACEPVFEWMMANLPSTGSRIDWSRVVGDHCHWRVAGSSLEEVRSVADEAFSKVPQEGRVIHAGDSISRFAVTFDAQNYRDVVPALIEIPEHHYFLSEPARDWLLAWTFEGDVDLLRRIVSTQD
jgi:hypothetical protein